MAITTAVCSSCGHRAMTLKRLGPRNQLMCGICEIEVLSIQKKAVRSKGARKR
jgi:hypothetical protein